MKAYNTRVTLAYTDFGTFDTDVVKAEIEAELTELERLAEIGRLTEKLLETGSMQHRFKYLDDIRSVEQLIEWGKDK